jgi:hypothetical protein
MPRKATREEQDKRLRDYFAHIRRTYGVTEEQFRALWTAQGGACAICLRPFKSKLPAVDHDHLTGYVRGLLCGGSLDAKTCNRFIGFHPLPKLRRAVAYLTTPPAFAVIGFVRKTEGTEEAA